MATKTIPRRSLSNTLLKTSLNNGVLGSSVFDAVYAEFI
jgi:hypothetical protein